jgi:polysulfide reductase chain C
MDDMLKGRFVFGWKIIVYLFLAGMGGGSAAVGAAFHLIHPGAEIVTKAAVMVGAPLVLLGCALLFTDLGLPGAAFRAISRPHKAWISRGSIILTIFLVFGAIYFGSWIWPYQGLTGFSSFHSVLNILYGTFGALTVIYTGFLFDTTRSIPFWSTPILPLLFLVSGVSTGVFALILTLLLWGVPNSPFIGMLSQFDAFVLLFEALIIFFYLHGMHEVTAARASVQRVVRGDLSIPFWVGVALVGLVIPFLLEIIWGGEPVPMMLASLCGLAGGLYVRYVVVSGAVKVPLNADGVFVYLAPRPE